MIDWILENTLVVSVLALGLSAAVRWLKSRPAVLHVLWLVLLARLVAPPIPTLSEIPRELPGHGLAAAAERTGAALLSFVPDSLQEPTGPAPTDERAAASQQLDAAAAEEISAAGAHEGDPELAPSAGLEARPVPPSPRQRWAAVLLALWIAGSGLMLARQVRGIWRFQSRVRRGAPPSAALARAVAAVAGRLDAHPPEVRVLRGLGSPVVWSFRGAVLCWPANGCGEELTPDHAILAHELAHLRRRDHWVAWLEVVALCTLWWNPVFWFVHRRMREQAELACDAWVVAIYPEERRRYAESLIDAAEERALRPGFVPALGATDSNVNTFRRRLEMILREPVSCRLSPTALAAVTLFTLLVLPVRSIAGEGPTSEADESPTSLISSAIDERVATRILSDDAASAFEHKDWPTAVKLYRELVARQPEDGASLHRLGYSLLATGKESNREEAAEVFARQSTLGHRVATAEYNVACARALLGERELALEHLHRAIHAGFDQLELMDADGDLASLRETESFAQHRAELERIQGLRDSAAKAIEKEAWSGAVESLTALVDEVPGDGKSWQRLGAALLKIDEPERAAECFARQAELGLDEKNGWFELGRLQAAGEHQEEAIESLKRAVAAGFNDYRVLSVDRRFDALRGDERFERLVEGQYRNEELARAAWAAYDEGDWESAAEGYGKLVEHDAADGPAWRKLGTAAFRLGAYELALEAFEHQAGLGHELEEALLESACAYARLGLTDYAVAYLERAVDLGYADADRLRRDPELSSLRDDPGFQHAAMRAADLGFLGKAGADTWEELAEQLEARLEQDPDDGAACYQLAWACLRLADYERAAEACALQDELGYKQVTARYNAACALSLSGAVDEAFAWLELAIEAGFSDESLMRTDLDIARLREDSRFELLVSRIGEYGSKEKEKAKDKVKWKAKSKTASYED